MHYTDIAGEYAAFLRDTATAIRAIGDPRVKVLNGGLAAGGFIACQCDGTGYTAVISSRDFMDAMATAVPNVFTLLDGWASHPYPARTSHNRGLNEAFDEAGPGLWVVRDELAFLEARGISLPVFFTETDWSIDHDGSRWSRDDIAGFTVRAYNEVWLVDPAIVGVMPFTTNGSSWMSFAWVDASDAPYPVYSAVWNLRCSLGLGPPCS